MGQTNTQSLVDPPIARELADRVRSQFIKVQPTADGIPTIWIEPAQLTETLRYLKREAPDPYRMLYDLTALDERTRMHRDDQPRSDFTIVYHLLSFGRNQDVRIKVPLTGAAPSIPSVTSLWPNANWYEREVWDMFGVTFAGHPHLTRILTPQCWTGHPLRKDHPARATEMGVYDLTEDKEIAEQEALDSAPRTGA